MISVDIKFIVEGEPFGQERPAVSTRGGFAHVYDRPRSKAYKKKVKEAALKVLPPDFKPIKDVPVYLDLYIMMPIPKHFSKKKREEALKARLMPTVKPDASNVLKGIEDALNGVAYADDKQICGIVITKQYGDKPCVEVNISNYINDDVSKFVKYGPEEWRIEE